MTAYPTLELPDLPSELIMEALADLRATEKNKKFKINMGTWHTPNGVCSVCFAGAVLAQKCNKPNDTLRPNGFDTKTANKLLALDSLRQYGIRSFVETATDNYDYNKDFEDLLYKIYTLFNAKPTWKTDSFQDEIVYHISDHKGSLCHSYEYWPAGFKHNMEMIAYYLMEAGY